MNITVIVQQASSASNTPSVERITAWVKSVFKQAPAKRAPYQNLPPEQSAHLTIRLVDEAEMVELNSEYRQKNRPTNVLSFPFEMPEGVPMELMNEVIIGDIAICAPVVAQEAATQHKTAESHWAHMVLHGSLHLLGYDHIDPAETDIMENIETLLMKQAGFPDPYHPLQPPSCPSAHSFE